MEGFICLMGFCCNCPLIKNCRPHYNVVMRGIQVGNDVLELPTDVFDSGIQRGTIIDSGTTLAYLPDVVYQSIMTKVCATSSNRDGLLKSRFQKY